MTCTAESDHKESPNEDLSSPPGSVDPFSLAEDGNTKHVQLSLTLLMGKKTSMVYYCTFIPGAHCYCYL